MSKSKYEIECYALHILQENKLQTVMQHKVAKAIKENNGYPAVMDDGLNDTFLATIIFLDNDDRFKCWEKLDEFGIKTALGVQACYVDKRYFENSKAN